MRRLCVRWLRCAEWRLRRWGVLAIGSTVPFNIHLYHHYDPPTPSVTSGVEHVLATILKNQEKIMSAISDFAAKQTAHNQAIADDLTAIKGKIDEQAALITTLQNSSGTLTTEDQSTLDQLETNNAALQAQADATAGKTPPTPPTDTPAPPTT